MKNALMLLTALLIVLMISACGGGGGSDEIVMDEPVPAGAENFTKIELEFTADVIIPDTITVLADTDILFVITNSDTVDLNEDHNLVGPDIGLQEILVAPGQTVRRVWHTHDVPGEYRVGCTIHPWIDMTIIVE
jgi:plastocyanin